MMAMVGVVMWSISLYQVNEAQNEKTVAVYQKNWQQELDHLQLEQRLWLQYRYYELSDWLIHNPDNQQQTQFINQYYQLYPTFRWIILGGHDTGKSVPESAFKDCRQHIDQIASQSTSNRRLPVVFDCRLQQQTIMGISGRFSVEGVTHELILLIPYFNFISEFKNLTGKQILQQDAANGQTFYHESETTSGMQRTARFDFGEETPLGHLILRLPVQDYADLWLKQAAWVIPVILLALLLFYYLFHQAYLGPLLSVTRKMEKVVMSHRPGHRNEGRNLAPGLALLHRYFMHLTHLVKHDLLTGLSNRVIFEERLEQAVVEGRRSGRKYALVLIDIDDFKYINRRYGQFIGDAVLKQLAKRLGESLRESDSLARLEKDNFALFLEFSHYDQISTLIDKVYQALSESYEVYGRTVKCKVRIGVSVYPDQAQQADQLFLKADNALLEARRGDWPVVFDQEVISATTDYSGFSVIQSLRQALNNDEFKLVYQPVVDLSQHGTHYFEALLRWKDEDRHRHPIGRTIELAEKNNLIKPLTQWIIETVCVELQYFRESDVKIAVNMSMINLHDEKLPNYIASTLQKYKVEASQLMFEITEGQIMQEPDQVIGILEQLQQMGLSLSIDDFGTGQASLTYLKNLPVETLKIDQSFVKNMNNDDDDHAIVEATIKLAHTLGLLVVAEGVESAETHDELIAMGCDYAQGYYLSHPLEQNMLVDWYQGEESSSRASV